MPVFVLGLCIILLAARLTIGVDLSDESYYAAFIDGWPKTGMEHSRNLMVHQIADFLVYPLALVFRAVNGGSSTVPISNYGTTSSITAGALLVVSGSYVSN